MAKTVNKITISFIHHHLFYLPSKIMPLINHSTEIGWCARINECEFFTPQLE
jgi:hypothetical protein